MFGFIYIKRMIQEGIGIVIVQMNLLIFF